MRIEEVYLERLRMLAAEAGSQYVLGRCISNPYNAAVNRQCQALNSTGTYTNTGNVLTLAGPNGTATYR